MKDLGIATVNRGPTGFRRAGEILAAAT